MQLWGLLPRGDPTGLGIDRAGTPAQREDRGGRGADGADGRACLCPHVLGLDPEVLGAALTWGSCPGACRGHDAG